MGPFLEVNNCLRLLSSKAGFFIPFALCISAQFHSWIFVHTPFLWHAQTLWSRGLRLGEFGTSPLVLWSVELMQLASIMHSRICALVLSSAGISNHLLGTTFLCLWQEDWPPKLT
jgi:hypothetical protein